MSGSVDRRSFLSRLAFVGAGAALAPFAGRHAEALTIDESAPRERLYLSACETRTAHERLIQELVAEIEGKADSVSPEAHALNVERVKAMSCPVCGCPLGAIQPYPTRF